MGYYEADSPFFVNTKIVMGRLVQTQILGLLGRFYIPTQNTSWILELEENEETMGNK